MHQVIDAYERRDLRRALALRAVQTFDRVLQSDPNNAPALQNLGIVALRNNDAPRVREFLDRALTLNPRLPLALNTRGVVAARENDLKRAKRQPGRGATGSRTIHRHSTPAALRARHLSRKGCSTGPKA